MKSFCLTKAELYLLRENVQLSPHPADQNGRQQGYTFDDLEMVETILPEIDAALGEYRMERRNNALHVEREMRRARAIKDVNDRELSAQITLDQSAQMVEALDERLGGERIVVSLEDAEADWLAENWHKRTNWNGQDAVRSRILAVRRALKKDSLIDWRRNDAQVPTVADFEKKSDKVVALTRKADAKDAGEAAEKVG